MSWIIGLKKKFTEFELQVERLQIPDEGVTLLTGPSGSGKSTLIRCLCGFESTDPFQWVFGDEDLMNLQPWQRGIGYMPQTLDLFPHLSARQNIYFPVLAQKLDLKKSQSRFELIAHKLSLEPFLSRRVELLSGGEKQRVALARALIVPPRIVICDEPFASLPEELRDESRSLIRELLFAERIPALVVSHDSRDQQVFADTQIILASGRILT